MSLTGSLTSSPTRSYPQTMLDDVADALRGAPPRPIPRQAGRPTEPRGWPGQMAALCQKCHVPSSSTMSRRRRATDRCRGDGWSRRHVEAGARCRAQAALGLRAKSFSECPVATLGAARVRGAGTGTTSREPSARDNRPKPTRAPIGLEGVRHFAPRPGFHSRSSAESMRPTFRDGPTRAPISIRATAPAFAHCRRAWTPNCAPWTENRRRVDHRGNVGPH